MGHSGLWRDTLFKRPTSAFETFPCFLQLDLQIVEFMAKGFHTVEAEQFEMANPRRNHIIAPSHHLSLLPSLNSPPSMEKPPEEVPGAEEGFTEGFGGIGMDEAHIAFDFQEVLRACGMVGQS